MRVARFTCGGHLSRAAESRDVRQPGVLITPMEHQDFLVILAEVATAFVGFSMIVGALSPRTRHSALRRQFMGDVALIGFFVIGGGLLPYVLYANGLSMAATWRVTSLALMLVWLPGYLAYLRALRRMGRSLFDIPLLPKAFVIINPAVVLVGNGLLVWNVIVGGAEAGARYLAALLILLLIAAFLFLSGAFGDEDKAAA